MQTSKKKKAFLSAARLEKVLFPFSNEILAGKSRITEVVIFKRGQNSHLSDLLEQNKGKKKKTRV